MSNTVPVTDSSFAQDVLASDKPVLVDFWATWCGPCVKVGPILEEIADENIDTLKVAKVNIDENPLSPAQYGVQGIPTLLVFVNGEERQRIVGFKPKDALMKQISKVL